MQNDPERERSTQPTREQPEAQQRERGQSAWQRRLLPFMIAMMAGLTIFFFWISLNQLEALQQRIERAPEVDLVPALESMEDAALTGSDRLLYVQWKTLALLERHALERRYHQANVLLMSRTWVRYLGFITGMILALVGAAFILGKLREDLSDLSLSSSAASVTLKSTSPGLVLAVLGTVLMLTTILTNNEINTRDAPLYTNFLLTPSTSHVSRQAPPQSLEEPPSDSVIISNLED